MRNNVCSVASTNNNLKSLKSLSYPSRIFKIEEMEMVLWLIKLVYFFVYLLQSDVSHFNLGLYIQFMAHDSMQTCSTHISSLGNLHDDLV